MVTQFILRTWRVTLHGKYDSSMLCQSYLALILSAVRFPKLGKIYPNIILEGNRAQICPHMCTWSISLIPCLTCMPYQQNQPSEILCEASVQRNRICALRTQYSSRFRQQWGSGCPSTLNPFSARICFRYCPSGNYRRWYGGLLHSAANVSTGTRLLSLPPTQRQWVHAVKSLLSVCVTVCVRVAVLIQYMSIIIPFVHSPDLSFCLSSRVEFNSNKINEYSYNMADCRKTPSVCFPFSYQLTWNVRFIFFHTKSYLYPAHTKYINKTAGNKSIQRWMVLKWWIPYMLFLQPTAIQLAVININRTSCKAQRGAHGL